MNDLAYSRDAGQSSGDWTTTWPVSILPSQGVATWWRSPTPDETLIYDERDWFARSSPERPRAGWNAPNHGTWTPPHGLTNTGTRFEDMTDATDGETYRTKRARVHRGSPPGGQGTKGTGRPRLGRGDRAGAGAGAGALTTRGPTLQAGGSQGPCQASSRRLKRQSGPAGPPQLPRTPSALTLSPFFATPEFQKPKLLVNSLGHKTTAPTKVQLRAAAARERWEHAAEQWAWCESVPVT